MQAKAASDQEARIRERAYELWELEGRPHGRDKEHWERAVQEMQEGEAGTDAPPVADMTPPVAKPDVRSPAKRGGRAGVSANGVADRRG